jgi:hypothetical protein
MPFCWSISKFPKEITLWMYVRPKANFIDVPRKYSSHVHFLAHVYLLSSNQSLKLAMFGWYSKCLMFKLSDAHGAWYWRAFIICLPVLACVYISLIYKQVIQSFAKLTLVVCALSSILSLLWSLVLFIWTIAVALMVCHKESLVYARIILFCSTCMVPSKIHGTFTLKCRKWILQQQYLWLRQHGCRSQQTLKNMLIVAAGRTRIEKSPVADIETLFRNRQVS